MINLWLQIFLAYGSPKFQFLFRRRVMCNLLLKFSMSSFRSFAIYAWTMVLYAVRNFLPCELSGAIRGRRGEGSMELLIRLVVLIALIGVWLAVAFLF